MLVQDQHIETLDCQLSTQPELDAEIDERWNDPIEQEMEDLYWESRYKELKSSGFLNDDGPF